MTPAQEQRVWVLDGHAKDGSICSAIQVNGEFAGLANLQIRIHNPGAPIFDNRCIEVSWDDENGGHVHAIPLTPAVAR